MEQRWFVWGFLGEQVDEPWGDWTVDEPWDEDDPWPVVRRTPTSPPRSSSSGSGRSATGRGRCCGTSRWTATASPGGRFADDPPSLEWICFHVLAEYARHAGHLDIAVELATK